MADGLRTLAVIPARGGSKGVPRKNLQPIGGVPLVARAAREALASGLDAVVVSTDDAEIAAVSEAAGAEVIDRPAALSGDAASSEAALRHALETLGAAGRGFDVLVFLQCTSPFFTAADIRAVAAPVLEGGFDAAFSAAEDHAFLWRRGADGRAEGVNHDHQRPRQRRQDLDLQLRENGAIYVMRTAIFREAGTRFCGRVGIVETRFPVLEIDTPQDLRLAEMIAMSEGGR